MLRTRPMSRLSLFTFAAGSCLAFASGAFADNHGAPPSGHGDAAKPAEPSGHGGGGGGGGGDGHGGGEPKTNYPPPPTAKPVTLKAPPPPAAPATVKKEGAAEPKPEPKVIKPAPALKPTTKPNAKAGNSASEEAVTDTPKTADEALAMLREGNQRWMDGSVQNPSTGMLRRKSTADAGQKPFAIVLTCADSRIPVERVFDRGVGEVFVARVAGNVAGPHESGTIEYAMEHLGAPVLVVMGHSKCGAVKATAEGAQVTPNIASLVEGIKPAVERARKTNPNLEGAEFVEAAVRENVWQSVFDLYKGSPMIVEMVRAGKVKVVGAVLDIGTGKVDWMGEHPWQDAIVGALSAKQAEPIPGEAPAQPPLPAEKTANAEPKGH